MLEEEHENFFRGGDKMGNASGHRCKVKISGSEKKVNENTYDISSIKGVTKTFHAVVVQNNSLRSWRYCVGARCGAVFRKKGVGTRRLKYRLPENPGTLNSPHTSARRNGLVEGHTYVNHVRRS